MKLPILKLLFLGLSFGAAFAAFTIFLNRVLAFQGEEFIGQIASSFAGGLVGAVFGLCSFFTLGFLERRKRAYNALVAISIALNVRINTALANKRSLKDAIAYLKQDDVSRFLLFPIEAKFDALADLRNEELIGKLIAAEMQINFTNGLVSVLLQFSAAIEDDVKGRVNSAVSSTVRQEEHFRFRLQNYEEELRKGVASFQDLADKLVRIVAMSLELQERDKPIFLFLHKDFGTRKLENRVRVRIERIHNQLKSQGLEDDDAQGI